MSMTDDSNMAEHGEVEYPELLDRGWLHRRYVVVHDDIEVLLSAGIIEWRAAETAARLVVPYERISIEVELSPADIGDSEEYSI